ncbi:hypothetical protein QE152_g32408 [Popillia japonica]|uniref:Retroviral polymerase SH3-like domain-containing protein n=1 Tax=Popillia japonica TaxID=7064 RepID=A0AAW1IZK6_POPJA
MSDSMSQSALFVSKNVKYRHGEKYGTKTETLSEKLVFVGYCDNTKGYRLINPINKTITIGRDVQFLENTTQLNRHEVVEEENETHSNEMIIFENKEDVNQADNTGYEEEVNPTEANKELRRSSRVRKPKLMKDYVTYYVGSDPQDPDEALLGPNGVAWKTAMNEIM